MKKSLLALAVLGAFAGVASAQSSVTLYGTLDLAGRYVKADGQTRRYSEVTNGINSSQLGFRGIEDLGGGLKAGFVLLGDLAGIDSGNVGSRFFGRRSTVSLFNNAGELRLGRDYRPDFWNQTIFDAFGTNGLGSSLNVRQAYGGTRQDNSIGYFLPANLGGFYGQAMVAAGEGGTTGDRPGRHIGGRIGFAAGPFDIAIAAGQQRFAIPFAVGSVGLTGANPAAPGLFVAGNTQKTYNIGGSYDFGFLKLLGYLDRETGSNGALSGRETMGSISAVVPMGQGEVHVGYDRSKARASSGAVSATATVDQWKATYQYNLSKRTAMYSTISRLGNKDKTALTLPGASGQTTPNGNSKGFELGVRHFF